MIVVLIRHAERDPSGADTLSAAGRKRADTLAKMFGNAGVQAIFTSEFARTKETARPLARALGITPLEIAADPDAARDRLRAAGPLSLVVGHSNTVPDIIAALGGPQGLQIDEREFDRIFVLTVGSGGASLLDFRYTSG